MYKNLVIVPDIQYRFEAEQSSNGRRQWQILKVQLARLWHLSPSEVPAPTLACRSSKRVFPPNQIASMLACRPSVRCDKYLLGI